MIRGGAFARRKGVSSRHAHKGTYAMKLTINTESGTAGCRQNRDVEARSGNTFVYSAWYYLPKREIPTRDMWNVFQFKSDSPSVVSIGTDPFWTINIVRSRRGGRLRLVLKWKGGLTDHTEGVSGPFANSPIQARIYRQHRRVVPIRRWFRISAHLQAVWSLHWAFGGAPGRRFALEQAARAHEVSGWKAELERHQLLERHSRQPGDDLYRRRKNRPALAG